MSDNYQWQKIGEFYHENKFDLDKTYIQFSEIGESTIRRYIRKYNASLKTPKEAELKIKETDKEAIVSGTAESADELFAKSGLDPELWEMYEVEQKDNFWDVHMKLKNSEYQGKTETTIEKRTNYQYYIKIKCRRKIDIYDWKKFKKDFIADTVKLVKPYSIIAHPISHKNKNALEINIFDLHLGKLGWHEETDSQSFDVKIAKQRFIEGLTGLLQRATASFDISEIVFPVGNDFFNSDIAYPFPSTTRGTPQQDDLRWQQIYRIGRELYTHGINILKEVAPVKVKTIPGNHDCYSDDTELLTKRGFIYFKELKKDDLIATVNNITMEMEYQAPTYSFRDKYCGKMYEFLHRHLNCKVTPNHRMFTRKAGKDFYSYSETKEEKYIGSYFRTAGINNKLDAPITNDWLRLFAWINTDGSIGKDSKDTYYIYQSKPKYVKEIQELLNRLNISYLKTVKNRKTEYIMGKRINNILKNQYTFTLNKKHTNFDKLQMLNAHFENKYKIPEILFDASQEQVIAYLQEVNKGDGTVKKDNKHFLQIWGKEIYLDQLQHLCVINNFDAKIDLKNQAIYINLRRRNGKIRKSQVKTINFDGYIWGISVPNTNLITRRNGITAIQGNSQRSFYLGDALQVTYENDPNVKVDNSPNPHKFYTFGKNLIGYTHGNSRDIPLARLITLMPVLVPELWAKSKFREWHLGDIHHKKVWKLKGEHDEGGTNIRYMRSLSGDDAWHHSKGYKGAIKGCEAYVWDFDWGNVANFNYNIIT